MRLIAMIFAISVLGVTSCKQGDDASPPQPPPAAAATAPAPTAAAPAAAPAGEAHTHSVACGCSQGQKCSNLIEVDGKYVPLEGELGLGEMAFCGKQGLKAEAAGELKDGKFVATSFKLVEQE